jgi:hypothetical protein
MTNTPLRNDGGRVITHMRGFCGASFIPHGRRRFCDDACRQAAWRERHPASTLPPLPRRVPRSSVIYECSRMRGAFPGHSEM